MEDCRLEDLYDGNFYHVCTEGMERDVLFRDDEDFLVARNYLALSAWKNKVFVLVFSLMSNHVHVLVASHDRRRTQIFIRYFKQLYSTYMHNKYGRKEALRGQADSIALISDMKYFRNCVAYILRNAICAKICRKVEEYPWSSYETYFRDDSESSGVCISSLSERHKRKVLKTRMNLDGCPYRIDEDGNIEVASFVRSDLVQLAFNRSGKFFLYHLGYCNDTQMEYEFVSRPQFHANDQDLFLAAEKLAAERFSEKSLSQLTVSQKCAMLKNLFFNNRSTIPQLARVMGIPRELVRKVLST